MPKDERKRKPNLRESNFQNAQNEMAKVVQYLEDIKVLYFKPMRMQEEINAVDKALPYLNKAIQRLTKRIELSQYINDEKQ